VILLSLSDGVRFFSSSGVVVVVFVVSSRKALENRRIPI